ncbi:MAG: GGDEF domain-containing protein [Acidimicrobiales bacterium]|jgi:diguanylate cyclase (GGDEF)-like protein
MPAPVDATTSPKPARRHAFGQPIRLWLYVFLVLAGGLAVVFGPLRHAAAISASNVPAIPWWGIFLLATAAELASVELPIRKTNVVLTLNDAVIIVALMGTNPFVTALVMACSLGIVQAAQKRAPVQVIFNFGAQLLATPLYYALLRFMIQPNVIFSTRSVIGYLLTVALLNELSNIEISAAMYLSEADLTIVTEGLASTAPMVAVIALGNGVIATIVLVMTVAAPVLLLTIPIPVLLSIAAYRAQITRRRQLSDIENLFAATRILSHSKSVHTGAVEFLDHLARMFHATLVELTLLPTTPGNPALVTKTVNGVADEVMQAVPVESLPDGLAETLSSDNILVTKTLGVDTPLARYIEGDDRPTGMGVAVPAADNLPSLGYLVVAHRNKFVGDFRQTDLQLLGTLAKQLAFALQNGRLHEDLALLEGAQDELVHKAFHDPLTGLANRALFVDHIDGAYHRAARAGNLVFLLYIDLDEFKTINDTFGHSAGDELLVQVAGRLNACVRATDTVARLGGDEFAILLEQAASLEVVEIIAQRIVASVAEPFPLATGVAEIGASVGIAFTDAFGQSAAQLMKSADAAMYTAKRAGKGRHCVAV